MIEASSKERSSGVEVDERAVTGVRLASSEIDATVVPSDDPEQPKTFPLESWDADDRLESLRPVLEGELLGGKYVVERMFAEGGMGIVCLGRHAQLDQPVAIKFLRRALSGRDSVVQRFLNEARALAALRSEHVVRVMDVGQLESGRPYLVMEHLDGIDLDSLVARDGPLPVETAVTYVLQVCEALGEAHGLGIVHRDIKPENLFLWSGGPGRDIVKVLDFGLAKRFGSSAATGPQDSMGSPCYMSPEQIVTPQMVDSRTDVWSLGVVLHVLVTGVVPFDGANATEVFAHVLNAAPRPLRDANPSADTELDAIVLRCLEKAATDRYATVSDLAVALNAYLAWHRAGDGPGRLLAPAPSLGAAPSDTMDREKIRIPGVHARWPGALIALFFLGGFGVYQADRAGIVRVRDATDGWLTPRRMGLESPVPIPDRRYEPPSRVALGAITADPVGESSGAPGVRAEPELDRSPGGADLDDAGAPAPMDDRERASQRRRFREFFESEGQAPARELRE